MKKGKSLAMRPEVQRELIEQSGELVADPPLNQEDQRLCESVAIEGFHAFDRMRWSPEQEANFLSRPSVRREIDRVQAMMQDAEGMEYRMKFMQRIRLFQMLPAAIQIIQRQLIGYAAQGDKKAKLPPTPEQYEAARDVLRWCGLDESAATNINVNLGVQMPSVDRGAAKDGTQKQKYDLMEVAKRSHVREALEFVIRFNAKKQDRLEELQTLRDIRRSKGKKKARR